MQRICTVVVMLLVWPTLSEMFVASPSTRTIVSTRRGGEQREETLPGGSRYTHNHGPLSPKGKASMFTPLASPDEPEETRKSSETNAEDQQHEQSEANPEHGLPVAGCNGSPLIPEDRPPRKARFVWYTERTAAPTIESWDVCSTQFRVISSGTMPTGTLWCRSCRTVRARRINTGAKLAPVIVDRVRWS